MKAGFLDKLIERIDRVSPDQMQAHLLRMVEEMGLLEKVFQALQEGVLILDGEGTITYLNAAACRLFGLDAAASVGQPLETQVRGLSWCELASGGNTVSRDLEVFYPENRYLNFYLSPIDEDHTEEGHAGYVMLVRDITQTRESTEKKMESERLSALTLLAAGVAHELGNPLNSLTIHLQLLDRKLANRDASLHDQMAPLLETARGEIKRLDFIIDQFLSAIRPSTPQRQPTDVNALVREAVHFLAPELKDRQVDLSLELHGGLPSLAIDPDQMKQAFYNVVRNAAQATGEGGGRVLVRSDFDDQGVTVAVEDDGEGISSADMARLFTPYFTTKTRGHGLGLLIVRRILRDHGGDIRIESEEGAGTTVTLFLPFANPRVRLLGAGRNRPGPPRRRRPKPGRAPDVIDIDAPSPPPDP